MFAVFVRYIQHYLLPTLCWFHKSDAVKSISNFFNEKFISHILHIFSPENYK